MAETKPKKPKFKYTRELVRIAVDDGMTQKQIGDLCRVEQSIVSGWLNGKTRAFEYQIAELKKRYGSRLNRTTSRVYLTLNPAQSDSRWEDTERARTLLALREQQEKLDEEARVREEKQRRDEEQAPPKKARHWRGPPVDAEASKARSKLEALQNKIREGIRPSRSLSLNDLIQTDQDNFAVAQLEGREHLTQVDGPVVLRYTFVAHKIQRHRDTYELEREPVARWIVHQQFSGKFVLVHQARRMLEGRALWSWEELVHSLSEDTFRDGGAANFTAKTISAPFIECADDAARWISSVHGPMDAAALLAHSDAYFQDTKTLHSPHDERTLPFLLRKMLVEHGHEVPGLVRISDSD